MKLVPLRERWAQVSAALPQLSVNSTYDHMTAHCSCSRLVSPTDNTDSAFWDFLTGRLSMHINLTMHVIL